MSDADAFVKPSVVVPCYNESRTIEASLVRLREVLGPTAQIVVVDDGSDDGTHELLQGLGERLSLALLSSPTNRGKGAAYVAGLSEVRGNVVAIHDADMEYDPRDLARVFALFSDPDVLAVYGVRVLRDTRGLLANRYYYGGKLVTLFINALYGAHLHDAPTCYKVLRTSLAQSLGLRGRRFDFEPEMTCKLLRLGVRIHETPISYDPRSREQGKKIGVADGLTALWTALRYRVL